MSLMDWMFPEQAGAMHLRKISESMGRQGRRVSSATRRVNDDVGFLALALLSLIGTLIEKGVISETDVLDHLKRLDTLDGAADGKISPDMLRGALGFASEPAAPKPAPKPRRRR